MSDEITRLRERIDVLEKRCDHLLGLVDSIHSNVSNGRTLEDQFIMPALLLRGGDAYRDRMLRWLDALIRTATTDVEEDGGDRRDLLRYRYWREVLRKREPYAGFAPEGWMEA